MFTPLSVLLFSKLCGLSEVEGRGERGGAARVRVGVLRHYRGWKDPSKNCQTARA